ncbi:hypothetical protein L6452_44124 [Arctium lappa]|uniref:Uncharacterized protein n=1 Tax=Arctium lappa TaxID=4217 RepID=A0ACB8XE93_ARCLA|nr:hypothetical protein L6452_44124 [Arctium lappa]
MVRLSHLYFFFYNSGQAFGWVLAVFRISIEFLCTKSVNGAYASAGELFYRRVSGSFASTMGEAGDYRACFWALIKVTIGNIEMMSPIEIILNDILMRLKIRRSDQSG